MDIKLLSPWPILFALLSSISYGTLAQCDTDAFPYASISNSFRVSDIKGCAGAAIRVCIDTTVAFCNCVPNETDSSGCICNIRYEKKNFDNSSNPSFQYTYNTPGLFYLYILYPNNAGVEVDSIRIEITDKTAPNFEVYACANNIARADIRDTQYDNYRVDFGDGYETTIPVNGSDPEHAYGTASEQEIAIQGFDNNAIRNCPVAVETFTPRRNIDTPSIRRLTVLNDRSVELAGNLVANTLYQLEIQPNGSGSFFFSKYLDASDSLTVINDLNLVNNYYCFRIIAIDPCSGQRFSSGRVCSIGSELVLENGNNALSWISADPSGNFRIIREAITSGGSSILSPFDTAPATARKYNDPEIVCETEYCYTLEADFGGGLSQSQKVCGEAISTLPPPPVSDLSIVASDGNSSLDWEAPADVKIAQYEVATDFALFTTEESEFADEINSGQLQASCYGITPIDQCNNRGASPERICSIYLSGSVSKSGVVELAWNDYSGFANGVREYLVKKFYTNVPAGSFTTNTTAFSQTDDDNEQQIINYSITAIPVSSPLAPAVSNILTLIKPNNIYYPDAFTPDGDGTNETFFVKGRYLVSYQLQIFNRWGEVIFASENQQEGWDGMHNSKPQQDGTYIFKMKAADQAGRELERSGSFILIRKQ